MDLPEQTKMGEVLRNKNIDRSTFFRPDLYSPDMPAAMAGKQAYFDRTKKYDLRHKDEDELGDLAHLFGREANLDADEGKLEFPNQATKDYYYQMTSRPWGGVWEGQVPRGTFKEDPLLSRIYQHLFGK